MTRGHPDKKRKENMYLIMRDSLLKEVNTQLIKHRKKASVNQVCLCMMQHDIQGFQFCYWATLTFVAVFFNGILAVLLASLYLSKSFLLLVFCHVSYKVLFSAIIDNPLDFWILPPGYPMYLVPLTLFYPNTSFASLLLDLQKVPSVHRKHFFFRRYLCKGQSHI